MNLILLIGALLFLYALVYKPQFVAILVFTLIIANINFDVKGLPLNSRAFITIVLFIRILFNKSSAITYPAFLRPAGINLFLAYMIFTIFVSWGYDTFTFDLLKQIISTILSAFCVYYYYFNHKGQNPLKVAIILSGIICFSDLAYTYIVFGSFPVQRLYELFTNTQPVEILDPNDILLAALNHNFFGQICAMAFVFIFADLIKNPKANKLMLWLLPVMFLGVLMSTSRSALVALLIVSLILIMSGFKYKNERRKVYKVGGFAMAAILVAILLFSTVGMYFKLESRFIDEVATRLVDEPIAIIQKNLGQRYNVQNLGSMDWREEASADAYSSYLNLEFSEKITGIGQGGFISRNLGHGLNSHNGILLILIESGIVGFSLYFFLIFILIKQTIRLKYVSPSFCVLLFILIFSIGQNNELTSATTFLFVANLIGELYSKKYGTNLEEDKTEHVERLFTY